MFDITEWTKSKCSQVKENVKWAVIPDHYSRVLCTHQHNHRMQNGDRSTIDTWCFRSTITGTIYWNIIDSPVSHKLFYFCTMLIFCFVFSVESICNVLCFTSFVFPFLSYCSLIVPSFYFVQNQHNKK